MERSTMSTFTKWLLIGALFAAMIEVAGADEWREPGLIYNETGGHVTAMMPNNDKWTRMFPSQEYRLLYQKPQSEMTVRGIDFENVYYGSYEYSCDGDIWLPGEPMVYVGIAWNTSNYLFESTAYCEGTTTFYLRTQDTAKINTVVGDATAPGDGVKPLASHVHLDRLYLSPGDKASVGQQVRFTGEGADHNGIHDIVYQARAPGGKWTTVPDPSSIWSSAVYRPAVAGTHKLRIKVKSALKTCTNKNGKLVRCVKNGPVLRFKAE